jgi:hypothetical protein
VEVSACVSLSHEDKKMAIAITISLPETLIAQAKRFAWATHREAETVLAEALEMMWPTLGSLPDEVLHPSVSNLSDAEVLALAEAKMDPIQNQRLGALQAKGKASGLTMDERYELMALMQIYQLGQLRKSEALAEAVQRGLRTPLPG